MSPPSSRLPIDRSTNLPSINTFGDLSNFLRHAVADEDSRIFSESMGEMAAHSEAVIAGLRRDRRRDAVAPLLMDMLTALRDHRSLVVNLGLSWRALYEYAAYLQALNNFRILIGQWLLQVEPWGDELTVTAADFSLVAWRTLGEGMLLIDMYERWLELGDDFENDAGPDSLRELQQLQQPQGPQVQRVLQWWQKLRR
jgi:hypothetical protein